MSLVRSQMSHSSFADSVQGLAILPAGAPFTRRQWVTFDKVEFRKDLDKSDLMSPPTNCDEYFACYDDTLRRLLNAHASQGGGSSKPSFSSIMIQLGLSSREGQDVATRKDLQGNPFS